MLDGLPTTLLARQFADRHLGPNASMSILIAGDRFQSQVTCALTCISPSAQHHAMVLETVKEAAIEGWFECRRSCLRVCGPHT